LVVPSVLKPSCPPATRTFPFASTVAVPFQVAKVIPPVDVKLPVSESYVSAEAR
jgi:hypothetical protein